MKPEGGGVGLQALGDRTGMAVGHGVKFFSVRLV